MSGYKGLGIEHDETLDYLFVNKVSKLPYINSNSLPSAQIAGGFGGGIAYDTITKRPYYSDGTSWFPIANSAPGNVESFSQYLPTSQTIPPGNALTTLINWSASTPFHTLPGWNLGTGIYTETLAARDIQITADVQWGGVSNTNLGKRWIYIMFFDSSTGDTTALKSDDTQAAPSNLFNTQQDVTVNVRLNTGDQIWVAVKHGAPTPQDILGTPIVPNQNPPLGVSSVITGLLIAV
jgi:hypothetical protein